MKSLKGIAADIHPIWKMCILVLSMLLSLFVVVALYGVIWGTRQDVVALKWLQVMQTIGVFIIPCFLSVFLWDNRPIHYLGLDRVPSLGSVLGIVALMLLALPCINLLSWCNQQMQLPDFMSGLEHWMQAQEESAMLLTERFIKADTVGGLLANVLIMALLPAIGEEVCFRGTLQNVFQSGGVKSPYAQSSKMVHLSIWVSAILFSAMHLQFYGFIPRMLLGAFLGYLLVWSGSLWLPIIAHFTNNAAAVLLYNYYYMRGISTDEIDNIGVGNTLWIGVISMLVTIAGVWMLYRFYHKVRIK